MLFIETPIFTKRLRELLSDNDYRKLQLALVMRPEAGKIIPESGGLRKIRWNISGGGKRGGLGLIYYCDNTNDTIYMLLIYKKASRRILLQNSLKNYVNS